MPQGTGLYVFADSQSKIVMTDENKIIGDAFAIFVKLFIVILPVVRFFPIETESLADRFEKPVVTALRQQVAFRQRHHEIEKDRAELIARLSALKEPSRKHPGYKRALKLLNDTFRKSKLAQRLAVLQAAAWLIDVPEQLTTTV